MKRINKKIFTVIILSAVILSAIFIAPVKEYGVAEGSLGAVDYLDYILSSPRAIYADDEIVAVSCKDKTVFFYQGGIYEKENILPAGQILRSGNRLYYSANSLLRYVEIGVFEEVKTEMGANNFAVDDNRLITMTNSGALFYEITENGFTPVNAEYSFPSDLEVAIIGSGAVHIADADYYVINSVMYKDGKHIGITKADYMAHNGNTLYFSNLEGLFRLDGQTPVKIISQSEELRDDGILGVCGFADGIVYIDGKTDKIMRMDKDGNISDFVFEVIIPTDASVSFSDTPTTIRVKTGDRFHRGALSDGKFIFSGTYTDVNSDYVTIGEIENYYVLYGINGCGLIDKNSCEILEQNTPITFDKGYVLNNCALYKTCVADELEKVCDIKKGDQITIKKTFILNGIKYYLAQTQNGEHGFILAGEATNELLPSVPKNNANNFSVLGKDNTLAAVIIILLSTGVMILALFVLLVKKEFIKL